MLLCAFTQHHHQRRVSLSPARVARVTSFLWRWKKKNLIGDLEVWRPRGLQMYGLSCRLSLWWQLVGAPWPLPVRHCRARELSGVLLSEGECGRTHACHIQYEQSLSLSSFHATGRPPILTSQFNPRQEKGISVNLSIPEFSFLWENSEPGFIHLIVWSALVCPVSRSKSNKI